MFWPASTGSGLPVLLVMTRSACVPTVVMALAELLPGLGSMVAEAAVAVFVITVSLAVLASILTTIRKDASSPLAAVALAKTMVPVPPATTASVRDQPAGTVADTKLVWVGSGSLTVTVCPSLGPALTKLMM